MTGMCLFLYLCLEDYEDIRGFVAGGYAELDNNEGPLTSLVGNIHFFKIKTNCKHLNKDQRLDGLKCLLSCEIQLKKVIHPIFQFNDTSVSAAFNLSFNLEKDSLASNTPHLSHANCWLNSVCSSSFDL